MSNYQIEDLENEACKKSNMAKRVVAGAGLAAAGAGAAFAATELVDESTPAPDLTAEDLLNTVTDGVSESDMPEQPEDAAQPVKNEEVHVYHHVVEEKPAEPATGVEYSDTTTFVDEYGNKVASVDQGTVDGEKFALYDNDGDGVADYFAYDANGDKVFQQNEIVNVEREGILMRGADEGLVVMVEDETPVWLVDQPVYEDDLSDINNDFTNEKSGETYYDDLADNNGDYRNNETPDQYSLDGETNGGYNTGSQYDVADNYYSDEKITGNDMPADDLAYDEEMVADDMLDASSDLAYDDAADDMSQYDLV